MIIKGNRAGNVSFWTEHLLDHKKNGRTEVTEVRGLLATDLRGALREMQAVASGSRSQGNFMYQANINPRADEHLTPEQWIEAVDTLERNLGLEGHQRVIVEHIKEGRQHAHVVWNRVDVDTMRVADIGGNWRIHEKTARELEMRFEHARTPSSDKEHEPAWELWEARAAERSGIDPKALKVELTNLWERSDNGQAFKAAIEERGYVLAQGDRRDFVVVDRAGDAHSLSRRLDGANTRQVREKMSDLDRSALPFVGEARAAQREQRASRAETLGQLREAARSDNATIRAAENRQFWQDQRERKDAAYDGRHQAWATYAEREQARPGDTRIGDQLQRAPFMVLDAASGTVDTLLNFVAGMRRPEPVPKGPGAADKLEKIRRQRQANAAMEQMRENAERGENLSASDVYALLPHQIDAIRAKGDDYIKDLIDSMERNRSRDHDYGRTRER